MHRFANPTVFMSYSGKLLPWIAAVSGLLLGFGLYLAFLGTPPDYQMGETVRIMYIHVPSAWLAMMAYSVVALSSFGFLVWRHPLADVSAKAAVPLGAAFTFLALVTGSLWGKPTWGTYWQWDGRMTSVLILFLLYLGLMALRNAIEDEILASRLTAVLALVGIILLPIIKYSVVWWNTLHQPASVSKLGKPEIHSSMLTALAVMAIGFTLLFLAMHLKAMRNEVVQRRVQSLQRAQVSRSNASAEPSGGLAAGADV